MTHTYELALLLRLCYCWYFRCGSSWDSVW